MAQRALTCTSTLLKPDVLFPPFIPLGLLIEHRFHLEYIFLFFCFYGAIEEYRSWFIILSMYMAQTLSDFVYFLSV